MLDAKELGRMMANYSLEGRSNIDDPIEIMENKTTREITTEAMTKLARAIVDHFTANAEVVAYVPKGQTLASVNGANSTPGVQCHASISNGATPTVDPSTHVVTLGAPPTLGPFLVSTPGYGDKGQLQVKGGIE